ncbi:hypothetical protein SNEBB_004142 [Seison nebaliae]|nr:hypothetical protein SNEBB_004142 [Seison nebaliae]
MSNRITSNESIQVAKRFLQFINDSPSAFHAVKNLSSQLIEADFKELKETDKWNSLRTGNKFFIKRNSSSLFAFVIGSEYEEGNGLSIIGTHSDSPCLKVKPISKQSSNGYLKLGCSTYGGGIWQTWMDRDLKIAGKVFVKNNLITEEKLIHINRPLFRIPHLAIHLQREMNKNFSINTETELIPLMGLDDGSEKMDENENYLNSGDAEVKEELMKIDGEEKKKKHSRMLMNLLGNELNCNQEEIESLELVLAEHQPACLGGIRDEFIFSPRLDNLLNAYSSIDALINSTNGEKIKHKHIKIAVVFDNEEVGSVSYQGANSIYAEQIIRRILSSLNGNESSLQQTLANSFLVSADQAHAIHPNYSSKHEQNHQPNLSGGIVLKQNANMRYATSGITGQLMRNISRLSQVPIQEFIVRNDSGCGSTIGPLISSTLGIPTADVGMPQLSMHSCREMAATVSVEQAIKFYSTFYETIETELDNFKSL